MSPSTVGPPLLQQRHLIGCGLAFLHTEPGFGTAWPSQSDASLSASLNGQASALKENSPIY